MILRLMVIPTHRRILLVAIAIATMIAGLLIAGPVTSASAAEDADFTGAWSLIDHVTSGPQQGNDYYWTAQWTQTGTQLTGTGGYSVVGTVSGSVATFTTTSGGVYVAKFRLTMSADGTRLTGTAEDNQGRKFSVTGTGNGTPPDPSKPDGVDWTVPDRLASQVSDWSVAEGIPPITDVYPDRWTATVFLTAKGKPFTCPAGRRYRWDITGPSGVRFLVRPKPGCRTRFVANRLGRYRLTPIEQKVVKGKWKDVKRLATRPVVLHDWLITAFGDSNGSGEGNGPFEFRRCNRSLTSYQYRTAAALEKLDKRTSVTLIWPSCSGAVIEHLHEINYAGINSGSAPLRPQIRQVADVVTRASVPALKRDPQRKVDAAIVSIGVNNIAFGPTMGACVKFLPAPCESQMVRRVPATGPAVKSFAYDPYGRPPTARPVRDWVDALTRSLPGRYDGLARAFKSPLNDHGGGSLGVKANHVFITQYPDFTTDDAGRTCVGGVGTGAWPESTWQFISVAGQALNRQVTAAGARHGWTVVQLDPAAFAAHGYCSSDSYFKGVVGTSLLQLNASGPFHPDSRGHGITAAATTSALCRRLYGNPDCSGKPPVLR